MRKVRHQGVSRRGQSLDHVAPESVPLTAHWPQLPTRAARCSDPRPLAEPSSQSDHLLETMEGRTLRLRGAKGPSHAAGQDRAGILAPVRERGALSGRRSCCKSRVWPERENTSSMAAWATGFSAAPGSCSLS